MLQQQNIEYLHLLSKAPKGADTQKYKHKNLNAILPDPGNIIGLDDSQLGKIQCINIQ